MTLSLYFAPNTCAIVPLISLYEAGAVFTPKPIDFRRRQNKSPNYLAINPLHKVPVLLIQDELLKDEVLAENVAIALWIAQHYPNADLLPKDGQQLIRAISLMSWFAAGIHPHISRYNSPAKYCDAPDSADAMRTIAQAMIFENYHRADSLLRGREFFFDHFTAVDRAHFDRVLGRTSVQKALAYEAAVKEEFARQANSL